MSYNILGIEYELHGTLHIDETAGVVELWLVDVEADDLAAA